MRSLITILLLLLSMQIFAQSGIKEKYEVVVETTLTKDEIFKNTRSCLATAFNDYRNVSQIEDKEQGQIIIKAYIPLSYFPIEFHNYEDGYCGVDFVLKIDIKEQKYRISIGHFEFSHYTMGSIFKREHEPNVNYVENIKRMIDRAQETVDNSESKKARRDAKEILEKSTKSLKYTTTLERHFPPKIESLIQNLTECINNSDDW